MDCDANETSESKQEEKQCEADSLVVRGSQDAIGDGLDPLYWSTVKMLITDIAKITIIESIHSHCSFKYYSRSIKSVSIVGFIIARKIKEKFIILTLDDSTGCINCKQWIPRHISSAKERNIFEKSWKIGDHVSISGDLNLVNKEIELTISQIDKIDDNCNDEMLHWLQCIKIRTFLSQNKKHQFCHQIPQIKLSKQGQEFVNILEKESIVEFEFSKLLDNVKIYQFCCCRITSKQNISQETKNRNCMFLLQRIFAELTRTKTISSIDHNGKSDRYRLNTNWASI